MEIEFDPAKDARNLAKHGLSLADAPEFEMSAASVTVDRRYNYDEVRYGSSAVSMVSRVVWSSP